MRDVAVLAGAFAALANANAAPNWNPHHHAAPIHKSPNHHQGPWPPVYGPPSYGPPSHYPPHHYPPHHQPSHHTKPNHGKPTHYPTTGHHGTTTTKGHTTPTKPTPTTTSTVPTGKPDNACASVSALVASFAATAPANAYPTVPAKLAYDCITSTPFNSKAAVELMDSLRPYIEWQTDLSYKAAPPAEYAAKVQAPYDFFANFDRIYATAKAGGYSNEQEFGFDLYRCFQKTHDGHFVFYQDVITTVFQYGRRTPLVSVSKDGSSIPEVYVYADILAQQTGNIHYTPSPLKEIDGQDATEFLLNWSQYGSLQDPDALWNNMFYLLGQVGLGSSGTGTGTFSGGGRGRYIYPGPTTTLTFANGTSTTSENYARVLRNFQGVESGDDLYQAYFVPPPGEPELAEYYATATTSSTAAPPPATATATPTAIGPGYPEPLIREMNNLNSGYFLEGEGYDDVAVLSVPTFIGSNADEIPFQQVNTYLIDQAVKSGKKKLIIDVSANGGGTILQGYDLFKQLFPHILPYGATRLRAHEAINLAGQEVSAASEKIPRSEDDTQDQKDLISSVLNYGTDADVNYKPFTSWANKYGPSSTVHGNDHYTNIIRWNMSDVLTPENSGGIYISGYGPRANITKQPFAAEDIVIVYDGYCASTCTIFSELMRQQGGVKTIALGGRPTKDIIQAVGGIKGTNDFPWSYILYNVALPFQLQELHDDAYYNKTVLGTYSTLPFDRSSNAVVNSRDGLRQGDKSGIPLQYFYEPADCRIYYTPAMAVDQTATWKTVADSAFNGVSHCVAGSIGKGKHYKRASGAHPANIQSAHEHNEALSHVFTEMDGVVRGGDGFMAL